MEADGTVYFLNHSCIPKTFTFLAILFFVFRLTLVVSRKRSCSTRPCMPRWFTTTKTTDSMLLSTSSSGGSSLHTIYLYAQTWLQYCLVTFIHVWFQRHKEGPRRVHWASQRNLRQQSRQGKNDCSLFFAHILDVEACTFNYFSNLTRFNIAIYSCHYAALWIYPISFYFLSFSWLAALATRVVSFASHSWRNLCWSDLNFV